MPNQIDPATGERIKPGGAQIDPATGERVKQQSAAPAPRLNPEARTVKNYASEIAQGAGRGVVNDVKGLYQTVRHPIDTATGIVKQGAQAVKAAGQEYRDNAAAPMTQRLAASALRGAEEAPVIGGMVQKAEQGGTELASPEAAGAAAEGIASFAAPEVAGRAIALAPRAVDAISGTSPRAIRGLVKDTKAENVSAVDKAEAATEKDRAKVDADNAKIEADRAQEVKEHHEKTKAAQRADEVKAGVASRKTALETGVNKLSDKFQTDLKATRDKAAAEADAKYQALDTALGEKIIESKTLMGHLEEASEKFKGSNTEPTIFKDIKKNVEGSDSIPYSDLQGYYSEIGAELKKGTLPGDVYTAYNTLQDAIGGEMQKIADQNGMGAQLTDARTSWRNLKQTFYDPKSPLRKALDAKEPGAAARAIAGKDRTGIEAIAKYDPDLAKRANAMRTFHEEAAATHPSAAPPKPKPTLGPKKEPLPYPDPRTASIKRIGEEDVQGAKAEALQKRADKIRNIGTSSAIWPAIIAMREVFSGGAPHLAEAGGEMVAGPIIGHSIANILEKPAVVNFLTKATARDIAAIPEDLRGDFPRIVQQAQKQGIKVAPILQRTFQGAAVLGPRKFDVETGTQPANELMPGGTGDISALPAPLQRVAETARIVKGDPTATYGKPDIATVDEDPRTITVRDPSRMEPQVMAHEYKHLLDRNLAPGFRAQFPKDDPKNPYLKPEDLYNLPAMRQKGMSLKNLPEEKQAQLQNAWIQYQKDPEMRKILQPWIQDMNSYPMSNVLPTDADQKGINTTPRAPAPPSSAFDTPPAPRNATDAWAGQH